MARLFCFKLLAKGCDLLQANRHCLRANLIRFREVFDTPLIMKIEHTDSPDVVSYQVCWHQQFGGKGSICPPIEADIRRHLFRERQDSREEAF
jgi:hypothetical protein